LQKIILITFGFFCFVVAVILFLTGAAFIALASNPPDIQISNPNISFSEPISQSQSLGIIASSVLLGLLGAIIFVFGLKSPSNNEEIEPSDD